MFFFGSMLLTIGYTNPQIARQLFGNNKSTAYQLLPAVPQALGLVVASTSLKSLFARVNIRWVLMCAWTLALITLVLTSQLDKITDTVNWNRDEINRCALGVYIPLNFFFGMGISYATSINSTYLGTVYTGKTRSYLISGGHSLYAIGAGLVPLAGADLIKNAHEGAFDGIRPFYYIYISFCVVALLLSCGLNYRFNKQTLAFKKDRHTVNADKSTAHQLTNSTLIIGIILIFCCFFCCVFIETGTNYNLSSKYVEHYQHRSTVDQSILIRGLGLFFFLQGLWRGMSPFLFRKVRYRFFILFSAVFIFSGYLLLGLNLVSDHVTLVYLVAFLLAIGIGNIWPILVSFVQSTFEEKRSLMTVVAHFCTDFSIFLTIIIANFMLASEINNVSKQVFCYLSGVLGFVIFGIMTLLYRFLQKKGIHNSDEIPKKTSIT